MILFVKWFIEVLGPILLYIILRETYLGLRGERQRRVIQTRWFEAQAKAIAYEESIVKTAAFRSRMFLLEDQRLRVVELWAEVDRIGKEMDACDSPFWRRVRA